MGGTWERMIMVIHRILDAMLLENGSRSLKFTHEVLTKFLAEACSTINFGSLIPLSTDPENPFVLTPSLLLTQKSGIHVSPDIDPDVE